MLLLPLPLPSAAVPLPLVPEKEGARRPGVRAGGPPAAREFAPEGRPCDCERCFGSSAKTNDDADPERRGVVERGTDEPKPDEVGR